MSLVEMLIRVVGYGGVLTCVLATGAGHAFGQWPQFRGPNGSGVDSSEGYPAVFSPARNVVAADLVILLCDQRMGSFLLAVDRRTGRQRWKQGRTSSPEGWATPIVFRPAAGPTQLIVLGSTRLDSYALETGESRWWMPMGSSGAMGTVVTGGETLCLSTVGGSEPSLPTFGAVLDKYDGNKDRRLSHAELLLDKELGEHFGWIDADSDDAITETEWNTTRDLGSGASGAVAIRPEGARGALDPSSVLWRFEKNLPYIPAPLLYQNVLYLVKTGGIVTSLDPATGRLLKEGRAPGALGPRITRRRLPPTARSS